MRMYSRGGRDDLVSSLFYGVISSRTEQAPTQAAAVPLGMGKKKYLGDR